MAEESSRETGTTRWVETARGILSYSQLAPLLAERVLRVQRAIDAETYAGADLNEDLILRVHHDFCADLVPDWAGKWRTINVTVGQHQPPPPFALPLQMRDYVGDLRERIQEMADLTELPETLAFAEGRFLSIHPFADFNGRAARLWVWELLRRLRLPPVNLAPLDPPNHRGYLEALRAADDFNYGPLMQIWRERFAQSSAL